MLGTAQVGADEAFEFSDEDEDDIESSVASAVEETKHVDINQVNYRTANLNKLGDHELKAHKAAMEVGF